MASEENKTGITLWQKAALIFIAVGAINTLKGCLGLNAPVQPGGNSSNRSQQNYYGKHDACRYIQNEQYPYDWKDSNEGACVIKRPLRNSLDIITPIGRGEGKWDGRGNLQGQIWTSYGTVAVVCYGTAVTGSSRGICGIPIR